MLKTNTSSNYFEKKNLDQNNLNNSTKFLFLGNLFVDLC